MSKTQLYLIHRSLSLMMQCSRLLIQIPFKLLLRHLNFIYHSHSCDVTLIVLSQRNWRHCSCLRRQHPRGRRIVDASRGSRRFWCHGVLRDADGLFAANWIYSGRSCHRVDVSTCGRAAGIGSGQRYCNNMDPTISTFLLQFYDEMTQYEMKTRRICCLD